MNPDRHPPAPGAADVARRVVSDADAALRGAHRDGVIVDGVLHYGAVDLDPDLLVAWILLSGRPDDQLPEWQPLLADQSGASCPVDYRWLLALRADIVARFAAADWSHPERIAVYADSAHRVQTAGGFHYFRG